ncbi:glycine receptor subunit alphaZ1-like [Amphibalanus amphitrite]|uniref:glycine receptor subunit alphaZ1-like n=1 Tax=Amphibalanus amphitrite TaxID=1232801 RepID=UPI001C903F34|nr:glycine receptor subunit alphaZ1-like [Amphibalanus amphitrite]
MLLFLLTLTLALTAASVAPAAQYPTPGTDHYGAQGPEQPPFTDMERPRTPVYREPPPPSSVYKEPVPPSRGAETPSLYEDVSRGSSIDEDLGSPISEHDHLALPAAEYGEPAAPLGEYDGSWPPPPGERPAAGALPEQDTHVGEEPVPPREDTESSGGDAHPPENGDSEDEKCVICRKSGNLNQNSAEEEDSVLVFEDILPEPPKQYDRMAPPKTKGHPTVVYFHVTVMTLDSINEESMTYAADIFFAQSWMEHRLRFPSNMSSDYRLLPVSWLNNIWQPDSYFKNAKQVTFQEMTIPNHYIWLHHDKTILYMVKLTLVLSCAMNFKRYPHDTQKCAMKIESISYTTDDLIFVWDPKVPLVVDHIELPQLDLVKNTTGDCTQQYATGNFTCVQVVFTFKRRLGYYLFHTYIPTCLIVIMSWISFWVRPEAVPARVTLGVTSLLTLTTQHSNSQKALPPVSYIKAIDIFMSSCLVFVFLSLIEYALVNIILGDIVDSEEALAKHAGGVRSSVFAHTSKLLYKNETRAGPVQISSSCPRHGHLVEDSSENGSVRHRCGATGTKCPAAVAGAGAAAGGSSGTSPAGVTVTKSCQQKARYMERRERALFVDKVSRVVFPTSFLLLNAIYWLVYTIEWEDVIEEYA